MSDLIVIGFPSKHEADRVLLELRKAEREYLVDLEDAVVVVRNDEGKVKLHQSHNLAAAGATGGGFWGVLVGLLFMHPLLGLVAGVATGAVAGALTDVGIDDSFMRQFAQTMQPGSSALFVLLRKTTPDKLLDELRPFEGQVLKTSLSYADEARLRQALEGHEQTPYEPAGRSASATQ
jgi:uncharacterized membrane protein